jgi:hypothetical protein
LDLRKHANAMQFALAHHQPTLTTLPEALKKQAKQKRDISIRLNAGVSLNARKPRDDAR